MQVEVQWILGLGNPSHNVRKVRVPENHGLSTNHTCENCSPSPVKFPPLCSLSIFAEVFYE